MIGIVQNSQLEKCLGKRMKHIVQRPIVLAVAVYWCMFWLLNALDKIFARVDLGFITWYGNHRAEKFTMYFDRLGFWPEFVTATLMFAFVVELAVACLFAWAIIELVRGVPGAVRKVDWAIASAIVVFFGFAVFDVVVGDRAELLEHSTYVGVLLISYLASAAEGVFYHLRNTVPRIKPAE